MRFTLYLSSLLSALIITSGLSYAELWSSDNYDEIPQPSIKMAIQGTNAHQRQWNLFHLYTMNLDVPGYIETGGYNHSKDGKITVNQFLRWRESSSVEETNRPLDFAIQGASCKGFFCIRLPNGQLAYTKDGRFKITNARKLVTLSGSCPVLNESGNEIFVPENRDLACSTSGLLFVNNNPIDKLKVVVFETEDHMNEVLEQYTGSILIKKAGSPPLRYDPKPEFQVRQGFISKGNVLKALNGDGLYFKYGSEASAKAVRSHIKLLTSAVQMANP